MRGLGPVFQGVASDKFIREFTMHCFKDIVEQEKKQLVKRIGISKLIEFQLRHFFYIGGGHPGGRRCEVLYLHMNIALLAVYILTHGKWCHN